MAMLVEEGTGHYLPYMVQSKLVRAAASDFFRCNLFGSMRYGLGVPLSQADSNSARNFVLVGATAQVFLAANFHEPDNAIIATASSFQVGDWAYTVSAALVSEVLAGLPQSVRGQVAQSGCLEAAPQQAAASSASLRGLRMVNHLSTFG